MILTKKESRAKESIMLQKQRSENECFYLRKLPDYDNIGFHTRLGMLRKKKINVKDAAIRKDTNKRPTLMMRSSKNYSLN